MVGLCILLSYLGDKEIINQQLLFKLLHYMYLYSVIIPHKDSLPLLCRCIDSIPKRSDLQVIVVDDNSNIEKEEWEKFLSIYDFIELYLTKEGKGAGYARNIGLTHAKGKWVIFADSDDFFNNGAFECFDIYSENDCDTVYFMSDCRDGKSLEIIDHINPIVNKSIIEKNYDNLRYRSYVPWGKMIKKDFIYNNKLRFEEIEVSNDIMFSTLVGYASNRVDVIPHALYNYTINNNSLYHKINKRRMVVRIKATKRVNSFLHDNNLDEFRLSYKHSLKYCLYFLPKHPFLFIWGIWASRYKGATIDYIRDLCLLLKNGLLFKIGSLFHR